MSTLGRLSLFTELWYFLRYRKKWWLGPIIAVLFLLAVFIVVAETSAIAPFIYTLF